MSEKIGNILKVNIPEFMQGLKNLDEYLDTAGEVLDDLKSDIDSLRNIKHYDKCRPEMVDINLHELGFEVPVNINLSIRRQVLRDLAEIHLRGSTEDGIKQLLRIIGITPTIHKGWLPNPEMVRNGWYRDYFTREEYRYTPDKRVRLDLLYGETTDTDDGTFFEGYSYWDIRKEHKTKLLPISGEIYDASTSEIDNVESTPYIIVRFDDDDLFFIDDESSIDPDTGIEYPFTVSEKFLLLEDIIMFFLVGKYRSTTLRIIVEANILDIHDEMSMSEKFELQVKDRDPLTNREYASIVSDVMTNESTVEIGDILIGDPHIFIGSPTSLYSRWWCVPLYIGTNPAQRIQEHWGELETVQWVDTHNPIVKIPLLGEVNLDTSDLPPHTVKGIYEDGTDEIISNGRIDRKFREITVSLSDPNDLPSFFTTKRIERYD